MNKTKSWWQQTAVLCQVYSGVTLSEWLLMPAEIRKVYIEQMPNFSSEKEGQGADTFNRSMSMRGEARCNG